MRGTDLGERDYFRRARDTSRLAISEPLRSRIGDFIVLAMAMPLRGADGEFAGAIVSSVNLMRGGLFADIREAQIGSSGYFAAVSQSGVVVLHPDPRRLLKPAGETLVDPGLERALGGWNGWLESRVDGVPSLTACQRLKRAPWVMVAVQPTAEAFAALARVDRVLTGGRAAAVALLVLFVWLVTSRTLVPLERLRNEIDELEDARRVGMIGESEPRSRAGSRGSRPAGSNESRLLGLVVPSRRREVPATRNAEIAPLRSE